MDFNNKVVLITGASTGIGKELVIQLANKNCKLAIVARRENLLNEYYCFPSTSRKHFAY